MNSWGWVDFSKKDRELARDIINSLRGKGALDELGIGAIRDGFAELFFPGTSTIQTRAKYFFLVPYQIEKLLSSVDKKGNYFSRLYQMEKETSKQMWLEESSDSENKIGIFGNDFFSDSENEWVKRPPSEVYWSGIRKLHLFTCTNENISLPDFLQLAAKDNENNQKMGNEGDEFFRESKNFHWDLPSVADRGDWEKHPTIDLTPGEAKWFVSKVTKELPETMFAFVIEQRQKAALFSTFSELEKLVLPTHLKTKWELAQNFSDFIQAAQTRFNYLLKNNDARNTWEIYPGQLHELAEKIDLEGIFTILNLQPNHNDNHRRLKQFLENLHKAYDKKNIGQIDEIIKKRERELKGERSKIGKNPVYYDNWIGGKGLSYRFPDAKRLINDILKAEGKYHA